MSNLQSTVSKISDPGDVFGGQAGAEGIKSSERLGMQSLGMQQDWMDYIKGMYEPFSDVATQALQAQVGLSGLGGGEQRQQMISDIEADPIYQAKLRTGEEAVLRGASATGGLRSGSASAALAQQSQALLGQEVSGRYNQLAGLSGQGFQGSQAMGTFGGETLGQMTGTLGSLASGQLAAGAAAQQRGSGILSGGLGALGAMFSDERLKTNIQMVGEKHGMPWYKWEWNETATNKFDLSGDAEGHMVSDVELKYPELVGSQDGYKTVNYEGMN